MLDHEEYCHGARGHRGGSHKKGLAAVRQADGYRGRAARTGVPNDQAPGEHPGVRAPAFKLHRGDALKHGGVPEGP